MNWQAGAFHKSSDGLRKAKWSPAHTRGEPHTAHNRHETLRKRKTPHVTMPLVHLFLFFGGPHLTWKRSWGKF